MFKGERIKNGLSRICQAEIGFKANLKDSRFLGVYELFFVDNFAGIKGCSTHNISLAYEIKMRAALSRAVLRNDQHSEYQWFTMNELLGSPEVHEESKVYFDKHS